MPEIEVLDLPSSLKIDIRQPQMDAETAYRTYVGSGMRSLRKTADLLGIPHGTVLSWSQRGQWQQRARDTDLEVVDGVADAAAAMVVAQQFKNIAYLARLREDETADHKDRIRAANMLMDEFKDIQKSVVGALGRDDGDELGDDELERLAQTPEGVAQLLARHRARLG